MSLLLQKLIGWVVTPIITWVIGWISMAVQKWMAMKEAKEAIEKKNAEILEVTEKAQTKEERDNAAKEVIRDI
jgi:phosphate/sulfate permease